MKMITGSGILCPTRSTQRLKDWLLSSSAGFIRTPSPVRPGRPAAEYTCRFGRLKPTWAAISATLGYDSTGAVLDLHMTRVLHRTNKPLHREDQQHEKNHDSLSMCRARRGHFRHSRRCR